MSSFFPPMPRGKGKPDTPNIYKKSHIKLCMSESLEKSRQNNVGLFSFTFQSCLGSWNNLSITLPMLGDFSTQSKKATLGPSQRIMK